MQVFDHEGSLLNLDSTTRHAGSFRMRQRHVQSSRNTTGLQDAPVNNTMQREEMDSSSSSNNNNKGTKDDTDADYCHYNNGDIFLPAEATMFTTFEHDINDDDPNHLMFVDPLDVVLDSITNILFWGKQHMTTTTDKMVTNTTPPLRFPKSHTKNDSMAKATSPPPQRWNHDNSLPFLMGDEFCVTPFLVDIGDNDCPFFFEKKKVD